MTDLHACLPAALRGPSTTITRIAAGLSGAGVYRVVAGDQVAVLKVADTPLDAGTLAVQRAAAAAGVGPAVLHVDEDRHAVVSAFVADRGFPALWFDPATRADALARLATALRQVHELPVPAGLAPGDPLGLLTRLRTALADLARPGFVDDAAARVIAEPAPDPGPLVLSHNDVNPTNLVFDGARVVFLDWDTAAPNDRYYDLAAIAVFLRMDEPTCRALVAAHDGAPCAALPARFDHDRRVIATLCGHAFLRLAHLAGHPGGRPGLDDTIDLAEVYARFRTGALGPGTPDGQWRFGLALIKAALAL